MICGVLIVVGLSLETDANNKMSTFMHTHTMFVAFVFALTPTKKKKKK